MLRDAKLRRKSERVIFSHERRQNRMKRPNNSDRGAANRVMSTVAVASVLGVSVTTVKRWVDEGILPAVKTPGGHRKLLLADVLRLARDGRLPQADLTQLGDSLGELSDDPARLREGLFAALTNGDADMVRGLLRGAYLAGNPITVLADQVISPLMHRIGDQWESCQLRVMDEHRATQICLSALFEVKSLLESNAGANRPVAVGGCPEHDPYVMTSLLAQMVLLDNGWDAINLGPHTPFESFRDAIGRLRPRLIWISASHLVDPEAFVAGFVEFYRFAEQSGVAVALGGQAITDEMMSRMSYTTFGRGLEPLAALARALHRPVRPPRRGRPPKTSPTTNPS
jgi:excisionase family DNA binding protein